MPEHDSTEREDRLVAFWLVALAVIIVFVFYFTAS